MRATIKTTTGIIRIPKNFAKLESITLDGNFIYKVKYLVNPVKAIRSKTYKVRISAALSPHKRKSIKVFPKDEPEHVIKTLLTKSAASKDITRQEKNNKIVSRLSDITKNIPNDKTVELSKASTLAPPKFNKELSCQPVRVDSLSDRNLILPVLDQNVNRNPLSSETYSSGDLRSAAIQVLYRDLIDPASLVGARTNSIRSAVRAIAGVASNRSVTPFSIDKVRQSLLVGSMLSFNQHTNQSSVKNSSRINAVVKQSSEWIEVTELIKIPVSKMDRAEFFFIFELLDSKDIICQTLSRTVAHSKKISFLQIPIEAPEILSMTIGSIGKTVLNIKQLDENATAVNIYRRIISDNLIDLNAQYNFIGALNINKGEGECFGMLIPPLKYFKR